MINEQIGGVFVNGAVFVIWARARVCGHAPEKTLVLGSAGFLRYYAAAESKVNRVKAQLLKQLRGFTSHVLPSQGLVMQMLGGQVYVVGTTAILVKDAVKTSNYLVGKRLLRCCYNPRLPETLLPRPTGPGNIIRRPTLYEPKTVFAHVHKHLANSNAGLHEIDLDGDKVTLTGDSLKVFARDGVVCRACGLRGRYFVKARGRGESDPTKPWFLLLYGVRQNGSEVLMTKDHIVPSSCGGPNGFANYQTMCEECNVFRGNGANGRAPTKASGEAEAGDVAT